jgi:hypothetical protein
MGGSTSPLRRLFERGADVGVVLALLAGALVPILSVRAADTPTVVLNEVLVHHTDNDTTEFIELYGEPGTLLDGLSLVVVEGDGASAGTIDLRVDLPSGSHLGGNGFYLVGNAAGLSAHYGVVPDVPLLPVVGFEAVGFMENGSQTIALVETAGLGAVGDQVIGGENVLDAVGFWDGGATDSWAFDAPVLELWDGFLPPGAHRVADGQDADSPEDWELADYYLGNGNTPTAASPFNVPPVVTCGPDLAGTEGEALSTPVSAMDPDGLVSSFTWSVSPQQATIELGAASPATAVGGAATTSVEVGPTTPSGDYVVTVTAWNDEATPQQTSCGVAVSVEEAPPPPPPPDDTSLDDLVAMVDRMLADGAVDGSKEAQLRDRLERVQEMLAAGQKAAAVAQLRAFANQVAGLSPKWIGADVAEDLAERAGALAEELASS